jgi:hypothetical protein
MQGLYSQKPFYYHALPDVKQFYIVLVVLYREMVAATSYRKSRQPDVIVPQAKE